jgi:hypothetical protein
VVETYLLDVDYIEDGLWTAAKSTDNIALRHEASIKAMEGGSEQGQNQVCN